MRMRKGLAAIVVLALGVLLVGGRYFSRRNEMVRKNETVKAAWSQVDVVLERRADLIPILVETVKGFAALDLPGRLG